MMKYVVKPFSFICLECTHMTSVDLFLPQLHRLSLARKPNGDLVPASRLSDSFMIVKAAADVLDQTDLFNCL